MTQRKLAGCALVCLLCFTLTWLPTRAHAVSLDKDGDMKLGVRTYVTARIGTQSTDQNITSSSESLTFPYSPAGHLRQNRYFIEAELDHDMDRLMKEGFGPFEVFNHLPFKIKGLKYHLTFRGEGDGIYDLGPREYANADQYITSTVAGLRPGTTVNLPTNPVSGKEVDVGATRGQLRKIGTDRERLFQAYVEASVPFFFRGPLFMRLGRQIWSWGETDGFRLLDQINPIDSSFGGFLISTDERRVPLDMARLEYRLGDFGPISEAALHMYGAIDNKVGFDPGSPPGSPWTLPNLGKPGATTDSVKTGPGRNFHDMRGGARFYWNMFDGTFSLAHYYTYFDVPGLEVVVPGLKRADGSFDALNTFPLKYFDNGYSAQAVQSAPLVQVTGASTTFAIESLYTIVRSEFAYFKDEPRFRQSRIDPFIFTKTMRELARPTNSRRDNVPSVSGGRELGDSINYVLGFDVNQYIRFLNPYQTFFFSTQFFYKRLRDSVNHGFSSISPAGADGPREGEVLPVPRVNINSAGFSKVEPVFVRNPTNQFLHTLFITTSYHSGQVSPSFLVFYDWTGAIVLAPGISFSRDPWRFHVEYDYLDASTLKGGSGVSLLRDRDNLLFQFEYAI